MTEHGEPKRCECPCCGGEGEHADGVCLTCRGTGLVRTCECGDTFFDYETRQWFCVGWTRGIFRIGDGSGGVAHCPGECGCRLSVVDGEPRVGEAYADLERDAQRFRAVAAHVSEPIENREACPIEWHFETEPTQWFGATLGEYADTLLGGETDE